MGVTFKKKNQYRTRECYKTCFAEVLVDTFILTYQYKNQQFRHYQNVYLSFWHIILLLCQNNYVVVE